MYVLCTLVLLSLNHLFKKSRALEVGDPEDEEEEGQACKRSRDEASAPGHGAGQAAKCISCGGSALAQAGLSEEQSSCVIHHSREMPKHGQPNATERPLPHSRCFVSSHSQKAQVSGRRVV